MATWEANVKVGGKNPALQLTVAAPDQTDARRRFDAQYGKANGSGRRRQ